MLKRHENQTFHVYDGNAYLREATGEEINLYLELERERDRAEEKIEQLRSQLNTYLNSICKMLHALNDDPELCEEVRKCLNS